MTNRDVPNADVIIATWWETAEWVAQLSPSKGVKAYLIQDHEIFPYLPVERAAATWRLPLHKIVVSQWLADLARTEYGDPHVSLVPNAVDHQLFWAPSRKKQTVPTVGLLYSTALRKACIIALQAFILASEHFPELRLVAFGAAEPVPELSLPQRVEFHLRPPQAKLRELYCAVRRLVVQFPDGRIRLADSRSNGLPYTRHRYSRRRCSPAPHRWGWNTGSPRGCERHGASNRAHCHPQSSRVVAPV